MRIIFAVVSCFVLVSEGRTVSSDFPAPVKEVLKSHCFKCHGPEKQKSDIRFDTLSTDFIGQRAAAETWHDAMNVVQLGEMPPADEPDLTTAERKLLVDWIREKLHAAAKSSKTSSGGVVMRRLNKVEYRYTLTDLLGVEADYGSELPSDPLSSDGFLNNGKALGMSGLQMEYYLKSARDAMGRVLVEGEQPERRSQIADKSELLKNVLPGEPKARLGRYHYFGMEVSDPPRSGRFVVRVTVRAELVEGRSAPFIQVHYGNHISGAKPLVETVGEIRVASPESKVYELTGWAESFPIIPSTGEKLKQVLVVSNSLDDGEKRKKPIKEKVGKKKRTVYPDDPGFPKVIVESVEFISNDHKTWPPAAHQRILFSSDDEESPAYISSVLNRFMNRAWRRPPTRKELETYQHHFDRMLVDTGSKVEATREILAVVLSAPQFLYLLEPETKSKASKLTDHELASRLSYFLWSSTPDAKLMEQAAGRHLRKEEVLRSAVGRLLSDEKSERFIEQFATQWLDLKGVDRVAVNPEFYPDFDTGLEPDMSRETHLFFREILRNDQSALKLLDADFTMANAALAKHYGLEGPQSQGFERVSLVASGRPGGLLAHGAMHLANSNGEDSHPIKRAVWILERLLHDPPAPPPPNVPSIDPSDPDFAKLPVRKQLEVHREDPACGDCHRGIDPWGIALENFDAVGQWRDVVSRPEGKRRRKATKATEGEAVDAKTTLPGGHMVSGIEGLKAYLLTERRDQFAHAFVTKLTTYALGRSLELADEPELEKLTHEFESSGYSIKALIGEIVVSDLFRSR